MSKQETAFGKIALPVLSNEHNMIHGGRLFSAVVLNAALGAAAALYIEMIIPEEVEIHLKGVNLYLGAEGTFELIEAPTLTTGVTALTAYNRKRSSTRDSLISLKSNPTGISGGTVIDSMVFDGGFLSSGTPRSADVEWILKEDTLYLLRLTNDNAGAQPADMRADWYEENE